MTENQIEPDYYHNNNIEVIDIIRAWTLSFALGNVIKYILRPHKSQSLQERRIDLQKARKYIDFALEDLSVQIAAESSKNV